LQNWKYNCKNVEKYKSNLLEGKTFIISYLAEYMAHERGVQKY
jgi:hypothetical protein